MDKTCFQCFIILTCDVLLQLCKPQSNGPLYSNTVIGTLAVDEWAVTFGTARRGMGGLRAPPSPLLAVPNVTAHPSTASVPICVLLYNGPFRLPAAYTLLVGYLNQRRLQYGPSVEVLSHTPLRRPIITAL